MSFEPLFAAGPVITAHALAAMVAFLLGLTQLALPKGTARHRLLGWLWVGLMLMVALSSFAIFELRLIGPFSPIHLLSVLTIASLVYAVMAARRGNIIGHRYAMLSLFFAALLITGVLTLLPGRIMHAVVFGG